MNTSRSELEREVEQTRAEVEETTAALRDRLSVGEVLNQADSLFRASGAPDFLRSLGRQVRENPLPLVLIGAGLAWLVISSSRRQQELAADDVYEVFAPDYVMSPEAVAAFRAALPSGNFAPAPIGFDIAVEAMVPAAVDLHPVPMVIVESVPELAGHRFCVVGERIVIVDPEEPRIVTIIEE